MTEHPSGPPVDGASSLPAGEPAPPSMTLWGRRAALWYLVVGALALVAMLVETVLGHAGTGTMFAAILAAPWSMLVAGMAPPLPRDWPMAAGLAVRMVPLGLFMLLNALIVASIAARSERDLKTGVSKPLVLLLLTGLLSSGCGLTSKQVVMVAAPVQVTEVFNGGGLAMVVLEFDLSQTAAWKDHRGDIAAVSDLSLMGEYANPLDGPFVPVAPADLELWLSATRELAIEQTSVWQGLHLEPGQTHRVGWQEGHERLVDAAPLRNEIAHDGEFSLVLRPFGPVETSAFATVRDFRLAAVLQVK
ncbi:MAG: hypothetical protein ABL977_09925 [Candidatus Eisenbacteria bacterium]